jgi:putative sigma-54 modulation protein
MQLNLTGHHVEITDALRQYVQKKLERVERHFDKVSNTHVILSVDSVRHKAEATVNMSGNNIFAEHTEADMYAAIDGLMDKLDRQVTKHKQKVTDHHKGRTDFNNVES